jgi:carboxylesterase type B
MGYVRHKRASELVHAGLLYVSRPFEVECILIILAPTTIAPFTEAVFNNPPPRNESEDCLYINVFAPKKAWDVNAPPYPVMYYMYGGGWKFGYSGLQIYDGSHFAGLEDVVLVTVNYRTNGTYFETSG